MSAKTTKDKLVTNTNSKVIIKINEIGKILTEQEQQIFLGLIDKLRNGKI